MPWLSLMMHSPPRWAKLGPNGRDALTRHEAAIGVAGRAFSIEAKIAVRIASPF